MFLSSKLSSLPHVRHGFLTNQYNIGARALHEYENLAKIKSMFHAGDIIYLNQTHSSIVHVVGQPSIIIPSEGVAEAEGASHNIALDPQGPSGLKMTKENVVGQQKGRLTGDALITQKTGLLLCVRTADCAPILIAHKTKPIITAIHAGWRGAILEKIIENTAHILQKSDDLKNYVVAVGPCLHQESFQAGPVIYNNVANKKYFELDPSCLNHKNTPSCRPEWSEAKQRIQIGSHTGPLDFARGDNKKAFNFPLFVYDKLQNLGFTEIDIIDVNTYTSPELFSFRRATHQKIAATGRQASVIMLA